MIKNEKLINFINKFKENNPFSSILFICQSGSHMFGLDTEKSDLDFKIIYLPATKHFFEKFTKN